MSVTLDLPEDLVNELSEEAAQLDISLSEYVLRILSNTFNRIPRRRKEVKDRGGAG